MAKIRSAREILGKDVVNDDEIALLEHEGRFKHLGVGATSDVPSAPSLPPGPPVHPPTAKWASDVTQSNLGAAPSSATGTETAAVRGGSTAAQPVDPGLAGGGSSPMYAKPAAQSADPGASGADPSAPTSPQAPGPATK